MASCADSDAESAIGCNQHEKWLEQRKQGAAAQQRQEKRTQNERFRYGRCRRERNVQL